MFPSVDKLGPRFVFNIGGNKFRFVAGIDFFRRTVQLACMPAAVTEVESRLRRAINLAQERSLQGFALLLLFK